MLDSEDDIPQLSAYTFAALQEFYKEQAKRENKVKGFVERCCNGNITFEEDWQLSQFWYDEITTETIVKIVGKTMEPNSKIALISCPTLYMPLKNEIGKHYEITLFEYDQRFAVFGSDFISYDYREPLNVPRYYANYYDLIIADPPFLSEECLGKTADTMKFLGTQKMMLCTGKIMSELAQKLLKMKNTSFEPHHKNNLANEFCCLSNFDIDSLLHA